MELSSGVIYVMMLYIMSDTIDCVKQWLRSASAECVVTVVLYSSVHNVLRSAIACASVNHL